MYNPTTELTNFTNFLKAEKLAKKSIETYTSVLKTFLMKHRKTVARISKQEIIQYLAEIRSPSTTKSAYWVIAKYLQMHGHRQKMGGVPKPKQPDSLPCFLSQQEMKNTLATVQNLKHLALLTLCYRAGLRISELLNLKLQDIPKDAGILRINNSKGAKDRIVPIVPSTVDLLNTYYQGCHPLCYLFEGTKPGNPYSTTSVRNVLNTALEKAGIPEKISVHGLRHSCATHLLNGGMNINALKEYLGHYSLKSTEIYLHCSRLDMASQVGRAQKAMA